MAASMDLKNMRAPAKKKLPTDPLTKSNLIGTLAARICVWKCTRKDLMMSA